MIRIEVEWDKVPDEGDLLECRSWARLEWSAGRYILTRVHDRDTRSERKGIYVPQYPIANWIVANWWSLLYEPWPFIEALPEAEAEATPQIQAWLQRHCLRAASPGYASPFTNIFSQGGDRIAMTSRRDPSNAYPRMRVEFLENVEHTDNRLELADALGEYVRRVLDRLEGSDDDRVAVLREEWDAICDVSGEEEEFCRAAGRLGLDPFDVEEWPRHLREWFERAAPGELSSALVTDLMEAPDLEQNMSAQHQALLRVVEECGLGSAADVTTLPSVMSNAHEEGYALAERVRSEMRLQDGERLSDVGEASVVACRRALAIHESNQIPEGRVMGVIGWRAGQAPVLAMRGHRKLDAARFLSARGVFMASHAMNDGPRLVTDGKTWDQRASRAFGAELLAPRTGVKRLFGEVLRGRGRDEGGQYEAESLVAQHYGVSPMVVRHQLENSSEVLSGWM